MSLAGMYVALQVLGRVVGWAGAGCFAFCAAPQVVKTIKDGHCGNLSLLFLGLWALGAALSAIGSLLDVGVVPWLLLNYCASLLFVSVLLRYKLFPRR